VNRKFSDRPIPFSRVWPLEVITESKIYQIGSRVQINLMTWGLKEKAQLELTNWALVRFSPVWQVGGQIFPP